MAEEQVAAASFNPDDASGLIDNVRAKITGVLVDFFTSTKGEKFVNINVSFKGDTEFTERYLLGGADQWAPDANKTGAIPLKAGGKVWNKSQPFRLMKSLIDAGFPKNKLGQNLSVLVGLDVHLTRVTDGNEYADKDGNKRVGNTLLVTKIYTEKAAMESGSYATANAAPATKATAAKAKTTAAPAAAAAAAVSGDDATNDEYVTEVLLAILAGGPLTKAAMKQPAFLRTTKDKKSTLRAAVQARLENDAFLSSIADAGIITFDGTTAALAG
jgi:hypothetical protein